MIFDRHANLKYKYGNRHFWASGHYVDTIVLIILCVALVAGLVVQGTILTKKIHTLEEERL